MKFEHRKCEVELAFKLRDRVRKFVEGDESARKEWKLEMSAAVAKNLFGASANPFTDSIVEAIGWTYENYSHQFRGKTILQLISSSLCLQHYDVRKGQWLSRGTR